MRLKMTKRGEEDRGTLFFFAENFQVIHTYTRLLSEATESRRRRRRRAATMERVLKGDKSRFIEISGLRKLTSCHTRYSAISGAIGGNVLGRGNYRKSLSFDLIVARWMKP